MLVGMEACGGAHYWAREITKLGHEVRLMPPHRVQPYIQGNKNDRNDARGICEAVTRPGIPSTPTATGADNDDATACDCPKKGEMKEDVIAKMDE
ncbi:MAG: transposase [Magnetococcales bacterium]|nr:transposase [Magnetococcales bacterium]